MCSSHKEFVEHEVYNNWEYGIEKNKINECLQNNKHMVCVLTPSGYRSMVEIFGSSIVVGIVIHTSDKQRILQAVNREGDPDIKEICRRFMADEKDFQQAESAMGLYHVANQLDGIEFAYEQVKLIIDIILKKR